jgi:hypothetical protein
MNFALACLAKLEYPAVSKPKIIPDREAIMKTTIAAAAFVLSLAPGGACNAQAALKGEPMMMNRGTVVLVDDGSCPKGQIKQVATELATGVLTNPYGAVTRKCIPKQKT